MKVKRTVKLIKKNENYKIKEFSLYSGKCLKVMLDFKKDYANYDYTSILIVYKGFLSAYNANKKDKAR